MSNIVNKATKQVIADVMHGDSLLHALNQIDARWGRNVAVNTYQELTRKGYADITAFKNVTVIAR